MSEFDDFDYDEERLRDMEQQFYDDEQFSADNNKGVE